MNEQLLKFIELCLTDGVITDKEREVIFRKATEYNVDIDECEIILESMIQQKNMSQNTENNSNTNTQVSIPKFGGYKQIIAIEGGENPRTIELNHEDEEDFKFELDSFLSIGFDSVMDFFNRLVPQDEFVIDLMNKYSKGSENRKIKKYQNGDYYEGKIVNEKANGFGELNIISNVILSNKKTKYIGQFINDTFLEGKIFCYNTDNDIIVFEGVEYADDNYNCSKISYSNGDKYDGDIVEFKRHGAGRLSKNNDSIIEGTWENDVIVKENLIVGKDSLFRKAAEIVVEAQQGSASLLQRKLKLGNNRAGSLIDELENAGIVGGFDGEFRKINIPNLESLEHFLTTGEIENIQILLDECKNELDELREEILNDKINQFIEQVTRFNDEKLFGVTLNSCDNKEKEYPNLFENITLSNKYLWALYNSSETFSDMSYRSLVLKETKISVLEKILKICNNSDKLNYHTIGMIYQEEGVKKNDLTLLKKSLQYFQSHDYKDKELGKKTINNSKILSLGIDSRIVEQLKNGNYTKLWKVNCFVSEPKYKYFNKKYILSEWSNSNLKFHIPSNGIMTEKGAVAFIKAYWRDIYIYCIDKDWIKRGTEQGLDKTKIEIIEINEIVFN